MPTSPASEAISAKLPVRVFLLLSPPAPMGWIVREYKFTLLPDEGWRTNEMRNDRLILGLRLKSVGC